MHSSLKVILILSSILGVLVGAQMTSIGEAIQGFTNCDGRLFMDRYIGRAPSIENYWNGTLNLMEWNLTEVRISLKLSSPAVLTVNEEDGRILVSEDSYHVTFFNKPEGYNYIKFHVQGKRDKGFPNVLNLTLNNQDICPDPKEWKSVTILSSGGNVGIIEENYSNIESDINCGKRLIQHENFLPKEGDWPWHVAIYHITSNRLMQLCVGTLISYNTILTSAHCVFKDSRLIKPSELLIRLGLSDPLIIGPNTQHNLVTQIIYNNEFNSTSFENDIAIMKLAIKATSSQFVGPACLWPKNNNNFDTVDNNKGTILGWRLSSQNGTSDSLSENEMSIVCHMECSANNQNSIGRYLPDKTFCAKYTNSPEFCKADSGGGIFLQRNDTYYIRGIVSFSNIAPENKSVCDVTPFIIFTDVTKYLNWIESNM